MQIPLSAAHADYSASRSNVSSENLRLKVCFSLVIRLGGGGGGCRRRWALCAYSVSSS
jgi:hypothetical protein